MANLANKTLEHYSSFIRESISADKPEDSTLWLVINKTYTNRALRCHCGKTPGHLIDTYLLNKDNLYASTFTDIQSLALTVQNAIVENLAKIYEWLQKPKAAPLELQARIMGYDINGKIIKSCGVVIFENRTTTRFATSDRATIILGQDPVSPYEFSLINAYPSPSYDSYQTIGPKVDMAAIYQSRICHKSPSARTYMFGRMTANKDFKGASYEPSLDAIAFKKVHGFTDGKIDQDTAYIRPNGVFIDLIRRSKHANHIVKSNLPKRAIDITRNKDQREAWLNVSPAAQAMLPRIIRISRLLNNYIEEVKLEREIERLSDML